MPNMSIEVIVTLVLGVPSLTIAILTWLESRHSRLSARRGSYALGQHILGEAIDQISDAI
jgi:hypothetical protein